MVDVTVILSRIERGDPEAAEQLLPLVYDELRRLAAAKLAHEKPGQTLQATALVHAAYIRLVDVEQAQQWDSRGHFFAAAAEAMRRILVDNALRKNALKRGGDRQRSPLSGFWKSLKRKPPVNNGYLGRLHRGQASDRRTATDRKSCDKVALLIIHTPVGFEVPTPGRF